MVCKTCGERYNPRDSMESEYHEFCCAPVKRQEAVQ
jgi:hypothetical protein